MRNDRPCALVPEDVAGDFLVGEMLMARPASPFSIAVACLSASTSAAGPDILCIHRKQSNPSYKP